MAKKSKTSKRPAPRKPRDPIPNLTFTDLFPNVTFPPKEQAALQEDVTKLTAKVVALARRRPWAWRIDTLSWSAKLVLAVDFAFPLSIRDCAVLHLVHKNLLNLRKQGKLYTKSQPGLRT